MLEGKRILLISIKFFNYENLIKEQLEIMGAKVDLYDERPSNSFFSKAIIRVKKEVYARKINNYFQNVIKQIRNNSYDYFLLIKGEATPKFFLDFLRKNNPSMKFIFYTYDSFKNNSNGLQILDYFDRKFTFDSNDAINYKIEFRPLFFANDYRSIKEGKSFFNYDVAFIGTAHSDRYTISEKAKCWCESNGLRMFTFYFSPSKLLFKFKKLTDSNFRGFDVNKISFKSLSHKEVIYIYRTSKVILDINHPGQNGLTMRTFETLGAGRKLITTNPNIKDYPFYDPQNVYVIERGYITFDDLFFKSNFKPISEELLNAMSLEGWIKEILGITGYNPWTSIINN